MIKKIFTRFMPVLLLAVFTNLKVSYAASTTIETVFTNSPGHTLIAGPGAPAVPQFITFTVSNNNTCPVTLTELHWFHVGLNTYTGSGTFVHSMNGAVYTLWYQQPAVAGAPSISQLNGWKVAGTSGPISNGTSPGSIIPVLQALNVTIPPSTTIRFALSATDTMSFYRNVAPTTFTNNGVTLNVAGAYWGAMPGPGSTAPAGVLPSFCGRIVFTNAGDAPPAPPTVTITKSQVCYKDFATIKVTVPSYITNKVVKIYNPQNVLIYNGPLTSYDLNFGTDPNAIGGDYKVTITDPNCGNIESLPTVITVTRIIPPAPTIAGKTNFCLNEAFTPVTNAGSGSLLWYYSAANGSPLAFTPPFNTTWAHRDTYYVSQVINGCEGLERTMVIYSAAPKPAPPIVSTPVFYCENDSAKPMSAKGQNLQWFYQPTGGIPSSVAPSPNTSAKDSFFYWVSQTIDGCESARQPVTAVVTFRPNGLILVSRSEICENDTLTLNYYGSAFVGSAYNWTFPPGVEVYGGNLNGPLYIRMDSAGLRAIELQVGHSNCYSEVYHKTITIDTLPTATIEARPNICAGQSELISLSSYTTSTDSFFWDFMGGQLNNYSTDQGPYGVTWATEGNKIISLRLVNKLCSATYTDTVNVHAKPDAHFTIDGYGSDKQYCTGDSMLMTPVVVSPTSTYSWTPARFFDNYNNASVAWGRIDFTGYVILNVKDQYGCYNSDSLLVKTKPCCEVYFPTAFSPNNDGKNDRFRMIPRPLGEQRRIDVRSLKIMNRWGQVVFETADEQIGWDGKVNGKDADLGNYFYYINYKCDNTTYESKGEFVLVR